MNPTDEFLIDAFKQQGLITDEILHEVKSGVENLPEDQVVDQDLSIMDGLLERIGLPKEEVVNFLAAELNMEAVDMEQVDPPRNHLPVAT